MTLKTKLQNYLGCLYPAASIVALLLVLYFLATIVQVEKPRLPLRELTPLPDYPDDINFADSALITESGLKWLMLTYFYWLVGLFSIGFCYLHLRKAFNNDSPIVRKSVKSIFLVALIITLAVILFFTEVKNTPLMSFEFLLRNIAQVGLGLVNLTSYSTALAYLVLIAIMVTMSLLLMPEAHRDDEIKQLQTITNLMYCAAAFLLVWIAQATEMYRFAATLLIQEEREEVLKLAPTISLMAGMFASLLLAATYLSSYFYLQARHHREQLSQPEPEKAAAKISPKQFLLAHWPKITAVLMPVLPGAIGSVLNVLAQPL